MADCLITRLKASVSDASLLKIGEFRFSFKSSGDSTPFKMQLTSHTGIAKLKTASGNNALGYNSASINASELTIPTTITEFYITNSDIELVIDNKYDLKEVTIYDPSSANNVYMDLDELYFSDIRTFGFCGAKNGRVNVSRMNSKVITLDLIGSELSFNLELLRDNPNLRYLSIYNSGVSGDVAVLGTLPSYSTGTTFSSYNNYIYGDLVAAMKTQTSCKALSVSTNKEAPNQPLTGDLAKLPASIKTMNATGRKTEFTWSNRAESSFAISIQNANLGNYVDTMLINQANCILNQPHSQWDNVINVTGSHDETNASVASAIGTIKAAGWSVTINGKTY